MVFSDNHKSSYLGAVVGGDLTVFTTGGTYNLTAGAVGLYPVTIDGIQGNALASGETAPLLVIGNGNWKTSDGPAPYMQGYKQNFWTHPINMQNVTRFEYNKASAAQNQVVAFGWDMSVTGSTADIGPTFYCGTTYSLKLEVLGDDALKTFNKNMYNNFDAWGGCCGTECSSGCTSTYADAACIMLQWKDRIYQTPDWAPESNNRWPGFIRPQVFINDGGVKTEVFSQLDYDQGRITDVNDIYTCNTADPSSVIAGLQITVAYTNSQFADCTWSLTDSWDIFPATVVGSLQTQDFTPCAWNTTINSSVPEMFKVITPAKQVLGVGNIVRHNIILEERYQGATWADSNDVMSLRMREIEDMNWVLADIQNTGLYDNILIEFYVANNRNRSGIFDGSLVQYMLYVPQGADVTQFTNAFQACLTAAGSGVTLRTING